ncbi:MAG: D-hexose-6-phosphate mutarotase [Myxococcota bacterium]
MSSVLVTSVRRIEQDGLFIETPEGAQATVLLYGGHPISFRPAGGDEVLYLSPLATTAKAKAVRGGIPIIFPRFDEGDSEPGVPRHGFARSHRFEHTGTLANGVELTLMDDAETRSLFPGRFRLRLELTLASASLTVAMLVENRGSEAFRFTAALHSYLRVNDLEAARVRGLKGRRYLDKVAGSVWGDEGEELFKVQGEVDRVFEEVSELELEDGSRSVLITQEGFQDAIIWNPGAHGAATIGDLPDEGYREMLCVEAGAALRSIHLAPGAAFRGAQTLSVRTRTRAA